MKLRYKLALSLAMLMALAGPAVAQKARLTAKAYISTVKIEISYARGNLEKSSQRYAYAQVMLDSLLMHYGPHAEAYFWMSQITKDRIDQTGDLKAKAELTSRLVIYIDSLKMACANTSLKEDFRKDCNKFIDLSDSVRVNYWRLFYNAGVEQLNSAQDLRKNLANVTDSAIVVETNANIVALTDSCEKNMNLAMLIDSTDSRAALALASAYEQKQDYGEANRWLIRSLPHAEDPEAITMQIAYNYLNDDNYAEAIPYLREYVDKNPNDTGNASNLAISYNNVKEYDSAAVMMQRVLKISPNNVDALSGVGRYYITLARDAGDSAKIGTESKDDKKTAEWQAKRLQMFDTARVYLKQVFELKPERLADVEAYAATCALLGKFADAAVAFDQATKLEPTKSDNWASLGDCYFDLKDFPKATLAYEKVAELEPNNKAVFERLYDLYGELGKTAKQNEAGAKLKSL
ncbi:MAG: tetratricopeptide repeat protein [candidate division Zixibacteria bacterium]|nr:tetratricopeptide repeat protein [candidate division Zixibacteria bacterium]